MVNSTQLWYGEKTQDGIIKRYSADLLFTYENNCGNFAYVMLDGKQVYSSTGKGAWNDVRKFAEYHMLKLDRGDW